MQRIEAADGSKARLGGSRGREDSSPDRKRPPRERVAESPTRHRNRPSADTRERAGSGDESPGQRKKRRPRSREDSSPDPKRPPRRRVAESPTRHRNRPSAATRRPLLPWLLILLCTATGAQAKTAPRIVHPGDSLQTAVREAATGDTLILEAGRHEGPVTIDRSLTLRGRPGAILDGRRDGPVIAIRADKVRVEGLAIRNSGLRLEKDDAGIHSTGANTEIIGNRIESCLHGIYFREARGGTIGNNTILGATGDRLRSPFDALTEGAPVADQPGLCAVGRLNENRRGNGIHLWSSSGVRIENNRVARTRDGIYFSFTDDCVVSGNEVRETRYGLHYMYSDNNRFQHNRFEANAAGAALMYSGDLMVRDNTFAGNRGRRAYGLLLQSVDDSRFSENEVAGNTIGVYAENSQQNDFEGNRLAANYVGFRMGGSSRDNRMTGNRFARNLHPAEAAGSSDANHWSAHGRGNRWQNNDIPDLDGDGVGELPHLEADLLGDLREEFPAAALLSGSPGLEALRFAHARGGVPGLDTIADPHPLVRGSAPRSAPATNSAP